MAHLLGPMTSCFHSISMLLDRPEQITGHMYYFGENPQVKKAGVLFLQILICGFPKKVKGIQCYYTCQKFDISKDARCIFRHIPEVCFFFFKFGRTCDFLLNVRLVHLEKRKKNNTKCWMYIIWRMLIYFVSSLLSKNTDFHSISEQTTFPGLILALETKDYTAGQKHWACSLSNFIWRRLVEINSAVKILVPTCISYSIWKIVV